MVFGRRYSLLWCTVLVELITVLRDRVNASLPEASNTLSLYRVAYVCLARDTRASPFTRTLLPAEYSQHWRMILCMIYELHSVSPRSVLHSHSLLGKTSIIP
ncbi:hypothetical protein HOY80DRAFT_375710 [Tuber brumale]|nr:hypothetical protein HOY80DRAFT_375710 [Tuber brumale]